MIDKTDTVDDRRTQARQSPTGQSLTESQFDETWAISGIVAREIHKSGSFREKLSDYAHAFARNERFDTLKAETIIRDIFRDRYAETMNQMREGLMNRKTEIEQTVSGKALKQAHFVIELIRTEPTMPFYQAYDRGGVAMATAQGITEKDAKDMMKTAFASHEGRELYDAGKEAEELYHKPTLQQRHGEQRKTENQPHRRKTWSRS